MNAKVEMKHEEMLKTLLVKISGVITDEELPDLRKPIDEKIESENLEKVIFDLSNVVFSDYDNVGFLIGRYRKCCKKGIKTSISKPNFAVDKILELSGVYSLIPKENVDKDFSKN